MIRAIDLTKRFGGVTALDRLEFAVDPGRITVMLGPSGCGKTTILRLIAGLERPDEGEIEIDGRRVSDPARQVAPRRRDLGMIFQDLALWPHMRALENVAFGLKGDALERGGIEAQAHKALARVAIEHLADRYPHQLSGGERQRLAIARALAPGRRYLLMDEPFSNLDPVLKEDMIVLVRELRESLGTTILYVTHNLDEALALADRILLMNEGRMAGELGSDDLIGLSQGDLMSWYRDTLAA